jgi:hypothetical protein
VGRLTSIIALDRRAFGPAVNGATRIALVAARCR